MSHLLDAPVLPTTQTSLAKSSQGSFHSEEEEEEEKGGPKSQPSAASNPADASTHDSIEVYGIDAYLANPIHAALLDSSVVSAKKENNLPQPVQLSTHTSHHVSLLYQACQAKLLTPIFDIEMEAGTALFRGRLIIGDATVTLNEQWRSKKEARERLAENGIEVVKKMGKITSAIGEAEGSKESNWVGMLQEYHNQEFNGTQSPIYTFYAIGQAFACTVIISSYQTKTFGSPSKPFPGKKLAQRNAAMEGVQFLILDGRLNADGNTMGRVKAKPGGRNSSVKPGGRDSSVKFQAEGNRLEVQKEATYAQKVADIAQLMGLNTPAYHFQAQSKDAPNILSGYVTFSDSPGLPSQLGEVRNVFGKKAAKEEVAMGAWEVLLKLAKQRGVNLG